MVADTPIDDTAAIGQGWFTLAAAWVVFGIPGVLFAVAAISHANRCAMRAKWPPIVVSPVGVAALAGLGVVVG
ncbi:hypothetical protein [Ruania halotolerans]|uniref:hypothetical protein n=1 Tax=Ruania halotolerans TaxID=2897773 RepID=UPI001E597140|nr:hypothetical protein [Ruania halotolerans]UFU08195.1 hypothetical protein LQF10_08920 [Ruania halotolerans]